MGDQAAHKRVRDEVAAYGRTQREWYREVYLFSDHWHDLRKRKFQESGEFCEVCGKNNGLHVHHVQYHGIYDVQTKDLQVLCAEHHRMAHEEDAKAPVASKAPKVRKPKIKKPKTSKKIRREERLAKKKAEQAIRSKESSIASRLEEYERSADLIHYYTIIYNPDKLLREAERLAGLSMRLEKQGVKVPATIEDPGITFPNFPLATT